MRDGEFATMMQHQEEGEAQKSMEKEQWAMKSTPTWKALILVQGVLSSVGNVSEMLATCRRHVVTKDMSWSYWANTLILPTPIIRYQVSPVNLVSWFAQHLQLLWRTTTYRKSIVPTHSWCGDTRTQFTARKQRVCQVELVEVEAARPEKGENSRREKIILSFYQMYRTIQGQ